MLETLTAIRDAWFLLWNLATVACLIGGLLSCLFGRRLTREEIEKIDGGYRWGG